MLAGPAALVIGAALGTVVEMPAALVAITILIGLYYGLVEGGHAHLVLIARFGSYGLVLGYTIAALRLPDALAAAGSLLLGWDAARGVRRTRGIEPSGPALRRVLSGWRMRWRFVLSAALCVGAANLVGLWIGLGHAHRAILTIVVVLHSDMMESADAITHRVCGTLLGVALVAALVAWSPPPALLLVAMAIIAALRWPAVQAHMRLGTACITAFVLLVAGLLAATPAAAMRALQDRLLAIMVGCCFALVGIGLHREMQRLARGSG